MTLAWSVGPATCQFTRRGEKKARQKNIITNLSVQLTVCKKVAAQRIDELKAENEKLRDDLNFYRRHGRW